MVNITLTEAAVGRLIKASEEEKVRLDTEIARLLNETREIENEILRYKQVIEASNTYSSDWSWFKKAQYVLMNNKNPQGMPVSDIVEAIKMLESEINEENCRMGVTNALNARLEENIARIRPSGASSYLYFIRP